LTLIFVQCPCNNSLLSYVTLNTFFRNDDDDDDNDNNNNNNNNNNNIGGTKLLTYRSKFREVVESAGARCTERCTELQKPVKPVTDVLLAGEFLSDTFEV